MINDLLPQVQSLLQNNQFLSGGFILMVIGAIAAYARNIPRKIWKWIKRRLFLDIEIQMRDEAFDWFSDWLAEQTYTKKWSRGLTIRTTRSGCRDGEPPRILFSPAPGTHWLFWHGYLLVVNRDRKENENSGVEGMYSFAPRETFNISLFTPFRRTNVILDLLKEARDVSYPPDDERISIQVPNCGDWTEGSKCRPRPLDSVILRKGVMDILVADLDRFLKREDWYLKRGIPYRRGYLLHGLPGNGKSSIVVALASHFKLDICAINLGSPKLTDDNLRSLFTNIPKHSIVLIEDIDCVFEQRAQTKDNKSALTFSGLLNSIDGVMASEGRLLFMSTNHIEKLDEALIRPGRCDLRMEIANADKGQARRLFLQFFPDDSRAQDFAERAENKSMANLQGHLLQHSDDPKSAVEDL